VVDIEWLTFSDGAIRVTRDRQTWTPTTGTPPLHARLIHTTAPNGSEHARLASSFEDELLDRLIAPTELDPAMLFEAENRAKGWVLIPLDKMAYETRRLYQQIANEYRALDGQRSV